MFSTFIERITAYMSGFYLPRIHVIDVVEILIIAVLLYFFINWIQRTRAYALLRGIVVIAVFIAIAYATQMTVILYIVQSVAQVALIAAAVIFQPELRKALETLGNKSFFSFLKLEPSSARTPGLADRTISEILRAVNEMSELRTGALIVFEQKILLTDYINTGIAMDSEVSSQLLVNIFEHNTPLHGGHSPRRPCRRRHLLSAAVRQRADQQAVRHPAPGGPGHQRGQRLLYDHRIRGDRADLLCLHGKPDHGRHSRRAARTAASAAEEFRHRAQRAEDADLEGEGTR